MNRSILAMIAAIALSQGCALDQPAPGRPLQLSEFTRPADSPAPAPPQPARTLPSAKPAEGRTGPVAESEGLADLQASPGEPRLGAGEAVGVSPESYLDGVVGQMNNRAVYVNDFLGPLADRLTAAARDKSRREWRVEAERIIMGDLNRQLEDELLLAEARARLSTEERRAGLEYFIKSLSRGELAKNYGSRELAEQSARDKGKTLDELLRSKEEEELIRDQVLEVTTRRRPVTWRDVQLQYEAEWDRYNKPPLAVFRLIDISTRAQSDKVAQLLEQGTDFTEIASGELNESRREEGGLFRVPIKGEFARTEFFPIRALDDAARKLTPGQHTGPVTVPGGFMWVKFENIEQQTVPLYDAQLSIQASLQNRRSREEAARFVDRLKRRASFTDLVVMTQRLADIAEDRYFNTRQNSR